MKKRRDVTAAEFIAERLSDPEWVEAERAREAAHQLRQEKLDAMYEPILDSLRAAGYPVASFNEIVGTYAPLPRGVVDVLLAALQKIDEVRIKEAIVRALGASHIRYDGKVLTDLFEATEDHVLRWAISNTLSVGKMRGVGVWILDAVQRKEYGQARQMLPLAAVRHNPPELANSILLALLSDMPGHVALGLAESGGEREIAALRVRLEIAAGWGKNALGQAINVIQRRLQERE